MVKVSTVPLAERMRPTTLDHYIGQRHVLGVDRPLRLAIESDHMHSMIFWGPPGVGKTTLARLIARQSEARFEQMSAVLAGVKDVRAVVERAEHAKSEGKATVLFVDEVHRFNKAQQDAFLPHVEAGTLILIGATTENPSFQLNNALLSRLRVYVLKPLTCEDLMTLLDRTLADSDQGLADTISLRVEQKQRIVAAADGDARQLLVLLELIGDCAEAEVTDELISQLLSQSYRRFDSQGELFYDQISALHKSVRGSDPDAALYWFCRMIDGGCDPHYLARRLVRIATEDIGNADPRAFDITLNAWKSFERLGSPEGELGLAQAVIYMACSAKSNAVYKAYSDCMAYIKKTGTLDVPMHLRNAPTKLMKTLGHGRGYRYAHNEEGGFAKGVKYFPDEMEGQYFYQPTERGLEIKISEKLRSLRRLNKETLE